MIAQIQQMNGTTESVKATKVESKAPVSGEALRRPLNLAVTLVTTKVINKETGKVMSVSKPTPITEEVVMPAGYEIASIVYNGKTYNSVKDIKITGDSGEITYYVVPMKDGSKTTTTTTTTSTTTTTTTTTNLPKKINFDIQVVDESGKELSKNSISEDLNDNIKLPTIKLPDGYQLVKKIVNGQEVKDAEFKAPADLTKPIKIVVVAKKTPVVEKKEDVKPETKKTGADAPNDHKVDIKPTNDDKKTEAPKKTEPVKEDVKKEESKKEEAKPSDSFKPQGSKEGKEDQKDTFKPGKENTPEAKKDEAKPADKKDEAKPSDKKDEAKPADKKDDKAESKDKKEDTFTWLKKIGIPEDVINKMKGYQPVDIQAHPFDTKVIKKGQEIPKGFIPVKVDGDNVYLEGKEGSVSWKSPASVQVETVKSGIENLGNCHYKLGFANTAKPVEVAPVSKDGKSDATKVEAKTQKISDVNTLGQLGIPESVVKTLKDLKANNIELTNYSQVKLPAKDKAPEGMIPVAQHGDLVTYESSQGKVSFKVPEGTKVPSNIKADKNGVYSITFDNPAKQIKVDANAKKDKESKVSNISVEVIENGKDESYFKTYSGIVGSKANIMNPVQQGYKVMYITVDGKKVKDVPTTFGDKDMKVVYHVSNETRKVKVQVINPSNQVVSTQEVSGLIDSEIDPSTVKLPAGYRLSTVIQNGKVVDKITVGVDDGEAKLMIVPTTQSTITLHYMVDGKEIQDPYIIVGTQGQKVGLSSNDIPSGYKVVGITLNGKPVESIPDKFGKDNWNVVLQLKPLTAKEKEEAKKNAEKKNADKKLADGKESTNTTGKQEKHKNGETASEAVAKAEKAATESAKKGAVADKANAESKAESSTATGANLASTPSAVASGKGLEDTGIEVNSSATGATVAVETSIALASGLFMGLIASKRRKGRLTV